MNGKASSGRRGLMSAKASVLPSGSWWWSMTMTSRPRARGAQGLVVARAAVARDEHGAAVGREARDVVGAEPVAGVAARAARDDLAAERAERRREHGGRRDAVDVVVAEHADGLPRAQGRDDPIHGLRQIGHALGRPQIGQSRREKLRRVRRLGDPSSEQDARGQGPDLQLGRERGDDRIIDRNRLPFPRPHLRRTLSQGRSAFRRAPSYGSSVSRSVDLAPARRLRAGASLRWLSRNFSLSQMRIGLAMKIDE